MTTVAFDGYDLAADRRMDTTNGRVLCRKICRVSRFWYAEVGDAESCEFCKEWLASGARRSTRPEELSDSLHGLVYDTRSDSLFVIVGERPVLVPILEQQHAVGSGGDFARLAMRLGKTAAEAIECASLFDTCTGDGVDVVAIRKRPRKRA